MDTRGRILEMALAGFARDGFAGTSIRRIARDVGVRESAIYAHFASKQEIFETLVERSGTGTLSEAVGRVIERNETPDVALPMIIDVILSAWDTPEERSFLSFLLREGGPTSEHVGEAFAAGIAKAQAYLAATFERWIAEGRIRAGFSGEQYAWEFVTPIATLRLQHLHASAEKDSHARAREQAHRHVEWFLACTRPPDGS